MELEKYSPPEQTFTTIEPKRSEHPLIRAANEADIFLEHLGDFSRKRAKHAAHAAIYEELAHLSNELRSLQNRMARCKLSIAYWKSRQNALNSCVKLPDEIHIEIWKYLVHDAWRSTMTLIRITQVCSHWRRLAMSVPVLWTWPYIARPRLAENLLNRAGNMKLTLLLNAHALHLEGRGTVICIGVLGDNPARRISTSQRLAATVFPRATTLIMDFSKFPADQSLGQECHKRCLGDMTYASPTRLENLEVRYAEDLPPHIQQLPDRKILDYIRDSPNLEQIDLTGTTLFSCHGVIGPGGVPRYNLTTGTSLRSIKVLKVSLAKYPNTQMASIQEVIETLQRLPLLTTLKLENVFRPLDEQQIYWCNTHAVTLKYLQDVHLVASVQLLGTFLASVSYHPQANILLRGVWDEKRYHGDSLLDYDQALGSIIQTTTRRISPFINFLALCPRPYEPGWKLSFVHRQGPTYLASVDVAMAERPNLISRLAQICPLTNVREICYRLSVSDLDTWKLFGALQKLQILKLDAALHPTFKRVFALLRDSSDTVFDADPPHTPSAPEVSTQFYFPALTQLSCDSSVLRRPEWRPEGLRSIEELSRIYAARLCWDRLGHTKKPWLVIH